MKSIILCEITMIKNSRYLLHTYYIQTSVFFRYLATLTSPAKGVGWGDWREGSNPSFSAIYVHNRNVVHVVFFDMKRPLRCMFSGCLVWGIIYGYARD